MPLRAFMRNAIAFFSFIHMGGIHKNGMRLPIPQTFAMTKLYCCALLKGEFSLSLLCLYVPLPGHWVGPLQQEREPKKTHVTWIWNLISFKRNDLNLLERMMMALTWNVNGCHTLKRDLSFLLMQYIYYIYI